MIEVRKPTSEEINYFEKCPIWECGVKSFDWSYDCVEKCLIIEGKATINTPEGNVEIKAGDFVVFPTGLKCVWNVKEPIRKHYEFS